MNDREKDVLAWIVAAADAADTDGSDTECLLATLEQMHDQVESDIPGLAHVVRRGLLRMLRDVKDHARRFSRQPEQLPEPGREPRPAA